MKIIKNFLQNKTIRDIIIRLQKSTIFKLLFAGTITLIIFSTATLYFENKFLAHNKDSNIKNFADSIWWAFVTSTTVGYGDYYPVTIPGRITGILLMFFGVSLVGVVTGNIASLFLEKQLLEERGLKAVKVKNHFIICGWKRDMAHFLADILSKNSEFNTSEIILINTAGSEEMNLIRSNKRFSGINYIHGDYIDENILRKANIKYAKKVLLLADRLVQGSIQEVDSRTVMAAITIKTIARSAYVAAEILDSKYERYLISASCDEIILTSEYNRHLIANASAGSGIAHIINELIDVNSNVHIATISPPHELIGKRYSDVIKYYSNENNIVIIGILENTGNFYLRKMEAISEAQKTPDISRLVEKLKSVKNMSANRPVINPSPDFIIGKYSKIIMIQGRGA